VAHCPPPCANAPLPVSNLLLPPAPPPASRCQPPSHHTFTRTPPFSGSPQALLTHRSSLPPPSSALVLSSLCSNLRLSPNAPRLAHDNRLNSNPKCTRLAIIPSPPLQMCTGRFDSSQSSKKISSRSAQALQIVFKRVTALPSTSHDRK